MNINRVRESTSQYIRCVRNILTEMCNNLFCKPIKSVNLIYVLRCLCVSNSKLFDDVIRNGVSKHKMYLEREVKI